jgi:hypothetical protein
LLLVAGAVNVSDTDGRAAVKPADSDVFPLIWAPPVDTTWPLVGVVDDEFSDEVDPVTVVPNDVPDAVVSNDVPDDEEPDDVWVAAGTSEAVGAVVGLAESEAGVCVVPDVELDGEPDVEPDVEFVVSVSGVAHAVP